MMNLDEFQRYAHQFVDWMVEYYKNIEQYPVKSQVKPREVYDQIPETPPQTGEDMQTIFNDFQNIILPGITHWQSPKFFGYFPANSSYPSVLAEMATSALAAQCMIWETSPSAAELEEKVLNWLKQMTGLPAQWEGVIQDSASSATLVSLLTAREKYSNYQINKTGFADFTNFRIYCSTETHSSIEKAVKIAGFGQKNLVKVKTDERLRLDPQALRTAIEEDLKQGKIPIAVVATLGTTGTTAIDPLPPIAAICKKYHLWLHVDAAFAGSALILPEYRWMIEGIEQVDTFVFNPHKWLFTNFDCSAYYVKDRSALLRTLSILPEYLKTASTGQVNDYRDWGIPLGRRFRALKLWFVIRNFGVAEMQNVLRSHLKWSGELEQWLATDAQFEQMAARTLNLVCFRFHPPEVQDEHHLDELNERLLNALNNSGKVFLTHTLVNGHYTLRMVTGQTYLQKRHVKEAWKFIKETAKRLI